MLFFLHAISFISAVLVIIVSLPFVMRTCCFLYGIYLE